MTFAQANQVRGLTVPGHALAPKPFRVGPNVFTSAKFGLPESCLTDPYHAPYAALLATFPIVADNNFNATDWSGDPATVAANTFNQATWPAGVLITVPPTTSTTQPLPNVVP